MRLMTVAESDGMDALVELDLSFSQARMLFLLAKSGEPMPIHAIAEAHRTVRRGGGTQCRAAASRSTSSSGARAPTTAGSSSCRSRRPGEKLAASHLEAKRTRSRRSRPTLPDDSATTCIALSSTSSRATPCARAQPGELPMTCQPTEHRRRQDHPRAAQDRRRRRARRDHVDPRRHGRQRRAADVPDRAVHRRRAARLLDRRVDRDGLHARAGRRHPADRLGRRPLRHQAPLHDGDRAVHDRLAAVRDGLEHRGPHRLPRAPGTRRRHADAAGHDDHDQGRRPAPHGSPDGDPRHPDAARPDHGPDPRWRPDRRGLVALGLPDQPADRHRSVWSTPPRAAQGRPRAERVARRRRHDPAVAGSRAAAVRRLVDPRARARSLATKVLAPGDHRRAADRRVRVLVVQAQAPAARPAPVQGPQPDGVGHHDVPVRRARSSARCCWCRPTSSRSTATRSRRPVC